MVEVLKNGVVVGTRSIFGWPLAGANGRVEFAPVAGSQFVMKADLVLLAMGFVGPTEPRFLAELGVARDPRGMVATDGAHRTSVEGIFAAGDVRRGASLIVWAIREGRDAAAAIHAFVEAPAAV